MIQEETVQSLAQNWIQAWNDHDLEAIMSHYAENIQFHSPFVRLLQFNEQGVIKGKEELERYFRKGLDTYPDLHFELRHVLVGVRTFVIYYTSVQGRQAAEVAELDENGKVMHVVCHYTPPTQ